MLKNEDFIFPLHSLLIWRISLNLEFCLEIWSANLECVFETLSLQKKERNRASYVPRSRTYVLCVPVVVFGNCFLFMA
jgi:hypothetical protein